MAEKIVEQEKKVNKFQWFLIVVLIPLLFAITVTLIVMTAAGANVFETVKTYGQKIPFVSSLVEEENPKSIEEFEKKLISLEAQIKDREAKIEQLELDIDGKEKEVVRAKLESEQLQLQINELKAIQEENKRAFKDIVKTYETISAKKAAPIIAEMSETEALKILTNIKADTLASILENLDPEKAAKFTELLTNETSR